MDKKADLSWFIRLQQKIAPEIIEVMETRYTILRHILFFQPVGRRLLARKMGLRERAIRNEVQFFKEQNLITIGNAGMSLSSSGEKLLHDLELVIRQLRGLSQQEEEIAAMLGLERVIIVPGDVERDPTGKRRMGEVTARFLKEIVEDGDRLAVTGGTTLAEVARALGRIRVERDVEVLPARGGLGEDVEIQANTIAARVAENMGGSYRLLHLPEAMSRDTVARIADEPKIKQLLAKIRRSKVIIYGIGTAEEMFKRRSMEESMQVELRQKGAVGEAFGYFFNAQGEVIHSTASLGLKLEDLKRIPYVIAVAGGPGKAEAIAAVMARRTDGYLITDQRTAAELTAILQKSYRSRGQQ